MSTRALTPRTALILAALMNLLGALIGTKVAKTVQDIIVPPSTTRGLVVVGAALVGAITWTSSPGTSAYRRRRRTR